MAGNTDSRGYFEHPALIDYNVTYAECAAVAEELMRLLNESPQPVVVSLDTKYIHDMVDGTDYTAVIVFCYDPEVTHLLHITDLKMVPKTLMDCFAHLNIKLVGYCLDLHFKKLYMEHPHVDLDLILPKCIDLELLANKLQPRKLKWGIPKLVSHYLDLKIYDNYGLYTACWNEMPLPSYLQTHSSTDVQAGLMLYRRLQIIENEQRQSVGESASSS